MKAIILPHTAPIEHKPLREVDLPAPAPGDKEILVKVSACGLCHTDLDEIEGRLQPTLLPIVPGHQVVGTVAEKGDAVTRHRIGDRVGVTWLYSSCGRCRFCQGGRENLCEQARWTGKDAHGGYAEYLWHERQITSVANVTRCDAEEFLPLAAQIPIASTVEVFQPEQANDALLRLKQGRLKAAACLVFGK